MKAKVASVIGMVMTLAPALSMTAVAAGPQPSTAHQPALATMACSAGTHWEAAGYIRGGRWRAAHCANDQAPHY
jgi:hypothetical protein